MFEYLGFLALILMGSMCLVAVIGALVMLIDPAPPMWGKWTDRVFFAAICFFAGVSGAFFLYQAYAHAPFTIMAR